MLHAGECIATLPVDASDGQSVELVLAEDLAGVVPKGCVPQVETQLPHTLTAPVLQGQPVGSAKLIAGGEIIAEAAFVAASAVERDDFPSRWHMYWHHWLLLN